MSKSEQQQLPLPLRTADPWPGFAQFLPGANTAALAALQQRLNDAGPQPPLWLLGPAGSGKTHLLGASMQELTRQDRSPRLLPLRRLVELDPHTLGLEQGQELVLLDDIDAVIGRRDWELALFALSNRLHDARQPLLCSSRRPAAALDFALPDLRSRLALAQCAELSLLEDEQRMQVLQARAAERGLELGKPVLDWLQTHYSRDLGRLLALLEQLDQLSMSRGRRITVPLIREHLET